MNRRQPRTSLRTAQAVLDEGNTEFLVTGWKLAHYGPTFALNQRIKMPRTQAKILLVLLLGAALLLLTGCPPAGIYRTARTLEPGEGDIAITFSATRFSNPEVSGTNSETGESESVSDDGVAAVIPNVIPEVSYHVGIAQDMEFGGRIAVGSLYGELDFKYRFLHTNGFHMAVQPAIGYQAAVFVGGLTASLPVLMTYELSNSVAISAGPYAQYTSWDTVDGADTGGVGLGGDNISVGGTLGLEISGDTFHIMPGMTYGQSITSVGDDTASASLSLTTMNFGVTFGWVVGREFQQNEDIQDSLDRIEERLESNDAADDAAGDDAADDAAGDDAADDAAGDDAADDAAGDDAAI